MVYRKSIIHCSCANAFYQVQAIHWDKRNLICFSTNFRFEYSKPRLIRIRLIRIFAKTG